MTSLGTNSAALALLACVGFGACTTTGSEPAWTNPAASRPQDPPPPIEDRTPSLETLHELSRVVAAQGRDEECERVLQRLLQDYPGFPPAYNELAELNLRHGRLEEAVVVLEEGLRARPSDPVLLNNFGMCRLFDGDFEGALQSFTSAASAEPRYDARHRANMAVSLALLGRSDEARALFLQVLPPEDADENLRILEQARSDAEAHVGTPTGSRSATGASR